MSNSNNTDMLAHHTNFKQFVGAIKTAIHDNTQAHTVPPLTTKAITTIQIDIEINIVTGIPNTKTMETHKQIIQ